MPNALTIIVPVVLSVVFLAVSFYLYTIFCHPQDSGLGTSLFSKIIVILGQSLAWAQLLLIILDMGVQSQQSMQLIYSIVYVGIFVLTVFVLPLVSALYEADYEDSKCKQFCRAFVEAFIISAVWCAVVFISYIFVSKYKDQAGVERQINIPMHMFLCQALLGWVLLAINGALGLVFFPYDLIMGFINRPRKITKQEAYQLKKQLQTRSDQLIQQGQKLQFQQQQFSAKSHQLNFFSRKRRQGQLKDLLRKFRQSINQLQSDHETFDSQLHIVKQNFLIPYMKLGVGILSVLVSFLWVLQLFGTTVYINGQPAVRVMDALFDVMAEKNVGFISAIFYGVMVVYMLVCLIKGNVIFGIKIPYVLSIHPLQPNKTYLNSLLFNTSIMLITSLSITEMTMIAFPNYLKQTQQGNFFYNQVVQLPIFGFLLRDRIYTIVFLSCFGLALVYLGIKICRSKKQENRRKENGKTS